MRVQLARMRKCGIVIPFVLHALGGMAQEGTFFPIHDLQPIAFISVRIIPTDTTWLVQREFQTWPNGRTAGFQFHMLHGEADSLGRHEAFMASGQWMWKNDVLSIAQLKNFAEGVLRYSPDSTDVIEQLVIEQDPAYNKELSVRYERRIRYTDEKHGAMIGQELGYIYVQAGQEMTSSKASGRKPMVFLNFVKYECRDPSGSARDLQSAGRMMFQRFTPNKWK